MRTMVFKKGDIVKVRQGVRDPDFGDDIGGWQGKISDVDGDLVCIDWDNTTLSNCPDEYIQRCEEDGLDWEKMYLSVKEIEPAIPRITNANLTDIKETIVLKHKWDHLGESISRRIHEVLKNVKITDEDEVMDAWEQYLRDKLSFPFDGKISQYQNRGPLQQGDKIRIHGIVCSDELYGVLVKSRFDRKVFHFPLCIIEVGDKNTNNYLIVDDYSVWFANR